MAKKKKLFKKDQLLALFRGGNYQKVVSKIKQFKIEGLTQEEVDDIYIESLKELANIHFNEGDIVRALRDVEYILSKDEHNEEALFLKLKYLAYLERFKDALELAQSLLEIKDKTLLKKVIFYYLVVNIYYDGSYNKHYLKKLALSRQKYILFLEQLFANNIEGAKHYLNECNPRTKSEKENIQAIKAIINSDATFELSSVLKPLYRLLLSGESSNIQNTKVVRENINVIKDIYKSSNAERAYSRLIHQKSAVSFEEIQAIYKKERDIRLVFNNIAFLIEEQEYSQAYRVFADFKDELVKLVESFHLLVKLEPILETKQTNRMMYNFFRKYLQLHRDKFSTEALEYLFFLFIHDIIKDESDKDKIVPNIIKLATQYDFGHIPFAIYAFANLDMLRKEEHLEALKRMTTKYNKTNEMLLKTISSNLYMLSELIELGIVPTQLVEKKMELLLEVLLEVGSTDKRLSINTLQIIDGIAKILIEISRVSKGTKELFRELLHKYQEEYQKSSFENIKKFQKSMDGSRSRKRKEKISFASLIEDLIEELNSEERRIDFDDEDDDYYYHHDIYEEEEIVNNVYNDFKAALKEERDPFEVFNDYDFTNSFWYQFFSNLYDIPFLMMYEYSRYYKLDAAAIEKIFHALGITLYNGDMKRSILAGLKKFTQVGLHKDVSFTILEFLLDFYKKSTTAWYLELIYLYLELCNRYNREDNNIFFFRYATLFCNIQEKKRFKTLQTKYEKVLEMLKKKNSDEPQQESLF